MSELPPEHPLNPDSQLAWQIWRASQCPAVVEASRQAGEAAIPGVHTCQTGRCKGLSFAITDDARWSCPLCGDHGPDITDEEAEQVSAEFRDFVIEQLHDGLAKRIFGGHP